MPAFDPRDPSGFLGLLAHDLKKRGRYSQSDQPKNANRAKSSNGTRQRREHESSNRRTMTQEAFAAAKASAFSIGWLAGVDGADRQALEGRKRRRFTISTNSR